jgi:hypothetical protein
MLRRGGTDLFKLFNSTLVLCISVFITLHASLETFWGLLMVGFPQW